MTPSGQTVCLCMIVKNEAPVIHRCLASVSPVIDSWVVVDTGSTDGTQDLVRAAMASLPGEVVERPWVDFAHNRSEALALCRERADYSLIIDADDALVVPPGFRMPELDADAYRVGIDYAGTTYQRLQVVSNALPWRFRGVLHEFLDCPGATHVGDLPLRIAINHEGHRSTDPTTYAKDAAILEMALAAETDPFLVSRYTFYLAQSYRDCGETAKAVDAYLRRATMAFWDQEIFVSLTQAGALMERLGRAPDEVLAVYGRATETCPSRVEAAHAASRLCRRLSRHQEGYAIASPAVGRVAPADGLFVETWVYEYGLIDEYAVNAYWAGHYRECLSACLTLLARDALPAGYRARIADNARFAADKLAAAACASDPPRTTARGSAAEP